MFYAHIVLAKKGPLARIWLAAHWDKKLTKAHVFETNIEQSVDGIMQPKVKLALRTSGHLLLGVVRIYSRKAKYLLADCNEAFVKIKMAFRPGMVDLPEGHREANVNAITLPEVFHDFDTALPELNDIDIEAQFSVNQSRADEITMREDYGSLSMSMHDDGFGDMGFDGDTPDIIRGGLDPNVDEQLFEKELGVACETKIVETLGITENDSNSRLVDGDGFGDEFGQPELFEGDLFGEPPLAVHIDNEVNLQHRIEDSDEDGVDQFDTGAPSPMSSFSEYRPSSAIGNDDKNIKITNLFNSNSLKEPENNEEPNCKCPDGTGDASNVALDQSTLLQNEDESFALAPIDASAYKGVTKSKRKRKLIVDEVKNISGEEMKSQLANTADIVTTLDLAPPTKRLMYWKETGGVEKLFALPSRSIPTGTLFINYQRHLVSHLSQLEDFACLGPSDLLALDNIQPDIDCPSVIQNKRGRKRKPEANPISQDKNMDDASINMADATNLSLAPLECVREVATENIMSRVPLNLGVSSDDLGNPSETCIFDSIRSPGHIFSVNEINDIDQIPTVNDLPFIPGNLNHSIESHEDLHQSGLTPPDLNHGHLTPHHSTIETIESIPNLPVEQVSSILNEAENMQDNIDYNVHRSCDIANEWNDYEFPPSVGVHNASDEQMENETDEQFEERVLNKRAAQMFFAVKNRINKQELLLLSELTIRNSRKQAAQKFYSLLVLKKFRALNVSQSEPYAEIIVSRGPLFENPKL